MTSPSDATTTTIYQPKSVLITGGCGFIGSNFINYMFDKWPSTTFVNIDKLICGADPTNVDEHIRHANNYHLVIGSIQDRDMLLNVLNEHKVTK
jgi:dTDP-D-glucose 4,6-dehydratase